MTLSTLWLQDIKSQEDKEHFAQTVYNSSNDVVLMKLKKILKQRLASLEVIERKADIYDSPNWAYLQADSNGTVRTTKQILQLLDHVKDSV